MGPYVKSVDNSFNMLFKFTIYVNITVTKKMYTWS